jgi:hypothetical protein
MSASGERKVKHGDVFDDGDEYLRVCLATAENVWFQLYINKQRGTTWLGDTMRVEPYVQDNYEYKFNIIDIISNALKD